MKRLLIFIVTILSLSCSDNSTNDTEISSEPDSVTGLDEQENVKSEMDFSSMIKDFELKEQQEKIQLLAIIYDEPFDTIQNIIGTYLEYSMSKENLLSLIHKDSIVENPILKTINSHSLSRKKTASIIFSYQYEMITKDEIIENYKDDFISEDHSTNYQEDVVANSWIGY